MVDFSNIKIDPEEQRRRTEAFKAECEAEAGKIEDLEELLHEGYLEGWDERFARSVINGYRLGGGYLSEKQWRQVERILVESQECN